MAKTVESTDRVGENFKWINKTAEKVDDILSEIPGLSDTVWGKRIGLVSRSGGLGFPTLHLKEANDWFTCACGRTSRDIPTNYEEIPIDDVLAELGRLFSVAVAANNVVDAARILVKIERRAAEVEVSV
jgi:hypothetical protein